MSSLLLGLFSVVASQERILSLKLLRWQTVFGV